MFQHYSQQSVWLFQEAKLATDFERNQIRKGSYQDGMDYLKQNVASAFLVAAVVVSLLWVAPKIIELFY